MEDFDIEAYLEQQVDSKSAGAATANAATNQGAGAVAEPSKSVKD
jgi:hypothetical protein